MQEINNVALHTAVTQPRTTSTPSLRSRSLKEWPGQEWVMNHPSPTISKGIASHVKTPKDFPPKLFPHKTSLFPGKRILHVLVDTHSEYRDPEREIRRDNIRSG